MSGSEEPIFELRPASGEPEGALVLLHGRGTDEFDLVPLFDLLDPHRRLVCATMRAPHTLPPGGQHWYRSVRIGFPHKETFDETYGLVSRWFDSVEQFLGLTIDQTVIGGFSQGAVMAYALGLGAGRLSPAALICLSGFLPEVEDFELDLGSRERLPVAIGHGTGDPVIPVEQSRIARDRLTQASLDVTYAEYPLAHMVDPGFLRQLQPWIHATLA